MVILSAGPLLWAFPPPAGDCAGWEALDPPPVPELAADCEGVGGALLLADGSGAWPGGPPCGLPPEFPGGVDEDDPDSLVLSAFGFPAGPGDPFCPGVAI